MDIKEVSTECEEFTMTFLDINEDLSEVVEGDGPANKTYNKFAFM